MTDRIPIIIVEMLQICNFVTYRRDQDIHFHRCTLTNTKHIICHRIERFFIVTDDIYIHLRVFHTRKSFHFPTFFVLAKIIVFRQASVTPQDMSS